MSGGSTAIVLLAAGGSTRLGRPKQLLRIGGRTLLRRAAEEALAVGCGPVTVVLGSEAPTLARELDGLTVSICVNEAWPEGMASSLRAGLRSCLSADPPPARVLVMLCDQPAVDRALLRRLVDLHAMAGRPATACAVEGRPGVPAIFERTLFDRLLALRGDEGARGLLRRDPSSVALLEWPAVDFDVDTTDDLEPGDVSDGPRS